MSIVSCMTDPTLCDMQSCDWSHLMIYFFYTNDFTAHNWNPKYLLLYDYKQTIGKQTYNCEKWYGKIGPRLVGIEE